MFIPRKRLLQLGLILTLTALMVTLSIPRTLARPLHRQGIDSSVPAAQEDATVVVEWMQLLYNRILAESISAPAGSRLYGYAGVTAYQAVLPGMPGTLSLSGQANGLGDMPQPNFDKVYDWPSTAASALSVVIEGILPSTTPGAADTHQQVQQLLSRQTSQRQQAVSQEVLDDSLEYGREVAKVMMTWVRSDGFDETRGEAYDLPTGDPHLWVQTNPNIGPIEPYWGTIRPFALYNASDCDIQQNIPFSSDPNSTFYAQAIEVKNTGDNLTHEQEDIAQFWWDTPGQTGTPAGHWVLIEGQMVEQLDLKLDRAAGMYARVGMALGDAFIAAWRQKYEVLLLRPVTYIDEYIDPNWQPFIASPSFPEYPSGHSVVSAAAAEVLTGAVGPQAFTDRSESVRGLQPRSFTSFEAAASEAGISRLYGGIHYRQAIENGLRMGRCIGQNVLNYVQLGSLPQGE